MSEEQAQPSPMGESISLSDLQNLLQIVDIAAERGAFKAAEFTQVGAVRDKLSTFLESVAEAQAEAAKAAESVADTEVVEG